MDRKTLAITPPSFFFYLRGAAFGSSKAFHCILLLSCLLLSSVNSTLHDSFGSNGYNTGSAAIWIEGLKVLDSESVVIQKADQNVCPSSPFFCFLSALGSKNQSDQFIPFPGLSCPKKSGNNSTLIRKNLSAVVWLSLKPLHIIEFQPFTGFFYIGDTTCYKPLLKELCTKKNTRELSVSVSGNGFMVNHQCEGFSFFISGESVKFLLFYHTELSWASGVAVFAVPMKATAPVLMLHLSKQPVFWVRTKKFSIAVLIAAALLILIFCFNDHFIEENNKRNNCNHIELREVTKPSTITISLEMDSLLRSIRKESLQGFNEVPKKSSIKPVASVSSLSTSHEEASEAMNLTLNTAKDKKRRRNKKKRKGGINGLTPERIDVSSSHSGNSTPNSPMSPQPPTTQAIKKSTKPLKPVLLHSATFPFTGVKSMIIQGSCLAPNVRAPGAKSSTEMKEEKSKEYNRYDIWGDHLTGLHLMDRFKEVREGKGSGFDGDESQSFFVKGPQNLLADSTLFLRFCNQWP